MSFGQPSRVDDLEDVSASIARAGNVGRQQVHLAIVVFTERQNMAVVRWRQTVEAYVTSAHLNFSVFPNICWSFFQVKQFSEELR